MTNEQEEHLFQLLRIHKLLFTNKYRKGAREHTPTKGPIWDLSVLQLVESAIEETLDQFAYLMTARQKLLGTDPESMKTHTHTPECWGESIDGEAIIICGKLYIDATR